MIKWNEQYQVYVSDDGHVYNKKMKEYKLEKSNNGYLRFRTKRHGKPVRIQVHRLLWETFKGFIPEGYEIDHINRIKTDNSLTNLRCVTRSENQINRSNTCEFYKKYLEHFNTTFIEDKLQYNREYFYHRYHGKCRWE